MWWEKKARLPDRIPMPILPVKPQRLSFEIHKPVEEATTMPTDPTVIDANQSRLGPSVVLKGDLSGKEDLVIEGNSRARSTFRTVPLQSVYMAR